jgi:hypothetical protein
MPDRTTIVQVWPKPAGQTVYSRGVSTPIGLVPAKAIDRHRIKIRSRVTASSATCRAAREFSRTTPPLRIEKSAGSKTPSRMPSPRGCPLESGTSAGIKVGFGRSFAVWRSSRTAGLDGEPAVLRDPGGLAGVLPIAACEPAIGVADTMQRRPCGTCRPSKAAYRTVSPGGGIRGASYDRAIS